MDYGLDMFAAYWIAVDQNGREYVYKEIHKPNMVVSEAAKYLKSVDDPETLIYFAPPDMWSRRNDTGRSVAEIFTDFGIYLSRAKADRHTGWIDVKEHLHPGFDEMGNKVAGLRIFANCKNLIHDIPLAQFDETDPDDMSKDPHEITHSLDAIRYFCTGRQIPMLSSEIHESCGFSEKASIRIGCNTYMPACDGDEIVKHGFMYFSLSKSENNELRKIMKKYGADTRKAI